MDDDFEEIKVKRRSGDKPVFESLLLQQISDGIDYLRDESRDILSGIDLKGVNDLDFEDLGHNTLNHIEDIAFDLSEFKSEVLNEDTLPPFIVQSSANAKKALNRDSDYIRYAQKRLNELDLESDDYSETNRKIIVLCDKAIRIDNTNPDSHYIKGLALVNLEEYEKAVDEFISALALKDDINIWISIADVNRRNGDFEDAINVYDYVLNKYGESYEAVLGKAHTYSDWGEDNKAGCEFEKAEKIKHDSE